MSDVETITAAVVALFVLLALVTLLRLILRRDRRWRLLRVGIFLERVGDDRDRRQVGDDWEGDRP